MPQATKPWYTSKTLWTGILIFLVTMADAYISGASRATLVGTASSAAMVLMRHLTSTGILWVAPKPVEEAPQKTPVE